MRLVFVHGMRQEGLNAEHLRGAWKAALEKVWAAKNLVPDFPDPVMPFYGDVLDRLTRDLKADGSVTARGGEFPVSETEEDLLRELVHGNGISDEQVRGELGSEVIARGPANWEWVQAMARALEKNVPAFQKIGLRFVVQVDAYLNRPHIAAAVDEIVGPTLIGEPTIVVAHSLGTIVTYKLLKAAGNKANIPLFITLGSPLGINAVKNKIKPPQLGRPDGVKRWINGNDPRDYVALYEKLDQANFASNIENFTDMKNRHEDAHMIIDYLSDPRVAMAINEALK